MGTEMNTVTGTNSLVLTTKDTVMATSNNLDMHSLPTSEEVYSQWKFYNLEKTVKNKQEVWMFHYEKRWDRG